MLDRTKEYHHIIMSRSAALPPPEYALPEGFSLKLYENGDEAEWKKIMLGVGEATDEAGADRLFSDFFTHPDHGLDSRMLFILDGAGVYCATATAWLAGGEDSGRPLLHFVAVLPGYQGRGLGRAVTAAAICRSMELDPGDIWLHSSTWSLKAVGMYKKFGFECRPERTSFAGQAVDTAAALKYIKTL